MLDHLAEFAYRRRRTVVVAWLALLVVAVTLGGRFGGGDTTDYGTPGSESSAANDLVADRFPAGSGDTINVVWRAPDVTAPAAQARVGTCSTGPPPSTMSSGWSEAIRPPMTAPSATPRCSSTPGTCPSRSPTNCVALAEAADGDGFTVDVAATRCRTPNRAR